MSILLLMRSILCSSSVDVVSIDRRDAEREMIASQRVHKLLEDYLTSDLLADTKAKVAELVKARSFIDDTGNKPKPPGWFRVFFTLVGSVGLFFFSPSTYADYETFN